MDQRSTFTGRRRNRKTKLSVRLADIFARSIISIGGIGTIVAISTVFIFLVSVVIPLFLPSQVKSEGSPASYPANVNEADVVRVAVDEYRVLGLVCSSDSLLTVFRLDTGDILSRKRIFEDKVPTAWSFSSEDDYVAVGFSDGTVQILRIGFTSEFINETELADNILALGPGMTTEYKGGIIKVTTGGQFRLQKVILEEIGEPVQVGKGSVRLINHLADEDVIEICLLAGTGNNDSLILLNAEMVEDIFTGEMTLEYSDVISLPYYKYKSQNPKFILLIGTGDNVCLAWSNGRIIRIRTKGESAPMVAEDNINLLDDLSARLTAFELLLGKNTIIAGDSRGNIYGCFLVPDTSGTTADGFALNRAKYFRGDNKAAVTALAPSIRRRIFAAGFQDGSLDLYYMTSQDRLTHSRCVSQKPIDKLAVAPKENGLIIFSENKLYTYSLDPRYPEASFSSLFAPIQYEGYADKKYIWQSSSGTDDFEPKLSLIPLIFGTIKATFYSILFGAPLALLAAVFTSEFLDPKWKLWIKPTIELMASLPSVVLGFLAALVFAPLIEKYLPSVLVLLITVPLCFIIASLLWQLLPPDFASRWTKQRFLLMTLTFPIGILLAFWLGPVTQNILFGADLKSWLNGLHESPIRGSALGGWVFLLLPVVAVFVAWVTGSRISPALRKISQRMERRDLALLEAAKFIIAVLVTLGIVLLISFALSMLGLDVRKPLPLVGAVADTYDQRNALVVGFVMAFAIIPIIYTIADDALTAVPEHLRAASLGAGATPWQTAVRIVIPAAMSGLFSALMIGLGRAVGETMIVLMALGNTPVMDMNLFQGARTLSANIAVELPEASLGSTHYRTLFLAALVLFVMTFVLNTTAEIIRLRFRKRTAQL